MSAPSAPPPRPSGPPSDFDRDAWRKATEESPALCLAYVKEHAQEGNPQSVVDTIDAFTTKRRMMNVGPRKGAVVDDEIRKKKPLVMVELGGYSGYSAVRFAALQREVAGDAKSHYYSFEYSPDFAEIIKEMVAFAGLANQVTVVTGAFADNVQQLQGKDVDIYFIDHEKTLYLSDAQLILAAGLVHKKGTSFIADNVWIPGAPDYVEFFQAHKQFTSTLHPVAIGVNSDMQDAVMVSEYLG